MTLKRRPQNGLAHWNLDRTAAIDDARAAHQAVGRIHRYAAHHVLSQMLLHFEHETLLPRAVFGYHFEGVVDGRQFLPGEIDVDDDADDLFDLSFFHAYLACNGAIGPRPRPRR